MRPSAQLRRRTQSLRSSKGASQAAHRLNCLRRSSWSRVGDTEFKPVAGTLRQSARTPSPWVTAMPRVFGVQVFLHPFSLRMSLWRNIPLENNESLRVHLRIHRPNCFQMRLDRTFAPYGRHTPAITQRAQNFVWRTEFAIQQTLLLCKFVWHQRLQYRAEYSACVTIAIVPSHVGRKRSG